MQKLSFIIPLAVLLCVAVCCQDKEALAELEAMKAQAEIETKNIEIVNQWLELKKVGDPENKIQEFLSPDVVVHGPDHMEILPIDVWVQRADEYDQPEPEVFRSIDPILAQGDKVAFRYLVEVNDQGRELKVEGMTILHIVEGKIKEFWIVEDSLGFAKQLGFELKMKEAEK
jgi:hypothetical protein